MRSRTAATLAATALLTATGCGSSKPKSDNDQVRSVLMGFTGALKDGRYGKACSLMTTEARAEIVGRLAVVTKAGSCEGALRTAMGLMDAGDKAALQHYAIRSVRVSGDTATAVDSTSSPSHLRKKAGMWLIDKDPDSSS